MKKEPKHKFTIEKKLYDSGKGFLRLHRARCKFEYEGTDDVEKMDIDYITRKAQDAVVIVPWYKDDDGKRCVILRSCIRPQFGFFDFMQSGRPERTSIGNFWELPAGIIENDEVGMDGILNAAARELLEEVGIKMLPHEIKHLGPRKYSATGLMAERLYFVSVNVTGKYFGEPTLDGSALEKHGQLYHVRLKTIINAIDKGNVITDTKTEIGLKRLKD